MYTRLELLHLVIACIVYVFGEVTQTSVTDESIDVTTFNTINAESHPLPLRESENKEEMFEKALIAKRKRKGKFARFNLRYLHNSAHSGTHDNSRGNFRHRDRDFLRDREFFSRKTKKHRTLLPPPKERKPNIILILTDDQDVELGSLNFMPHTTRLVRDGGAEFRHAYVTTPMCCPSRSSLLTGMYVHNHNVFTNNENCSSQEWQRTHETRTFATYLSNAGYRTGYFGKYLNKYNGSYVPAGWREWAGLIMNSRYYNYSINLNGRRVRHGDNYLRDYYSDLIANDSVSFLRQSKQYFSRKPVMLTLSFPAPHGPEDSAPQFSNMFFNVTTHHTPTYDFAPNPDKQWILQVTNRMGGIHKQFTDLLMTKRLQTLQSVDVAVERIYQELKNIGELDNTYIVYTSDHGYHLGQFGLVKGKSFPFEFDVRVPFLVRGPGIQPGTVVDDIVLNIDLAPTFLDMAGVEAPPHMDGRSILKLLHPPRGARRPRWPDTFLIESSGRRDVPQLRPKINSADAWLPGALNNNASEVDEEGSGGTEDSGSAEMDDDEPQHITIPSISRPILPILNVDLAQDNKIPGLVPKPSLMSEECKREDLQLPCRSGQKWFCVHDGARWRRHKCRPHTCACFTQQGYLYTRPVRPGYVDGRDADNLEARQRKDEIRSDSSLLHMLQSRKRRRRDTSNDHLEEIVDDLDSELEDAKENDVTVHNTTLWQCSVTAQGAVNCSDVVYSNYPTWKQTRKTTDLKIRQLKSHLAALKELRKHLRQRRPQPPNETATTQWPSVVPFDVAGTTDDFISTTDDILTTDSAYITQVSTDAAITTTVKLESRWDNKIGPVRSDLDTCFCSTSNTNLNRDEKEAAKEARRRVKEEKHRKKERKSRKKARMEKECLSEKMNCFSHDNDHWRTPPLWNNGPFCFCMNANNNTYSCLRTINATHNFLYCEFVTGLVTFYNVRIDPFEQLNRVSTLSVTERNQLSEQLADLKSCRGTKECTLGNHVKWQ